MPKVPDDCVHTLPESGDKIKSYSRCLIRPVTSVYNFNWDFHKHVWVGFDFNLEVVVMSHDPFDRLVASCIQIHLVGICSHEGYGIWACLQVFFSIIL